MYFDKVVYAHDSAFEVFVLSRLRKYLNEIFKIFVVGGAILLDRAIESLAHVHRVHTLVKHFKSGRQAEFVKVFAYQRLAKRVYGAYMTKRHLVKLFAESVALFALGRARNSEKLLMQPFFQLVRGGVVVHENEHFFQ